ncbi:hypothetical protein, partial [Streptococcus danieliae]|uniref:hypothetical protein n=1 Tax=Streptococcus danieliae TaxID=747656 RepID=UPI001C54F56C
TPIPISLVIQLGSKGKSLQFLVRLIHTFKLCFGVYTKFLTHPNFEVESDTNTLPFLNKIVREMIGGYDRAMTAFKTVNC